jgi:hypothetical protein
MEGSNLNRQNTFREASGLEAQRRGPNPDMRAINIAKSGQNNAKEQLEPDFTFAYGMAVFWDIVTFLVGLIPVVGWAVNAFIVFPLGLFVMYMILLGKGKNTQQFWNGFKYIWIEAVPYLNIVPTFVRGVWLIQNEGKTTGLSGIANAATKIVKK